MVVFRELLSDDVVSRLCTFLLAAAMDCDNARSCYAEFVSKLYEKSGGDLTEHIKHICYYSENVYVRALGEGKAVDDNIVECVNNDLRILSAAASLTPDELTYSLKWNGFLPRFQSHDIDLVTDYNDRISNIGKFGYGQYAFNHMFYIDDSGAVAPVSSPDTITLDELVDYKSQ